MHLRNLLSKFRVVSSTMLLYSLVSAVCLLASTVKMTPFYTYDDHSPSTIDVYVTVEEELLKYPTKKGNSYPKYLLSGYRDNLRQHLDIETLMRQYLQSHLISKKQLQDNDYYSSQDCKCTIFKLIMFQSYYTA